MGIRRTTSCLAALLVLAGCQSAPSPRATAFEPDSMPDAYRVATGALLFPGTTRAWLVTPEGDLYNGAWRLRVSPSAAGEAAGSPRRIAAEERWLPVLHWTRRAGAVRWDFSAAAFAAPAPRDSQMLVSLEIRARNEGAAPAEAALELALEPRMPDRAFVAWDATGEPPRWNGGAGGPAQAWTAGASGSDRFLEKATLAPGETRVRRVMLPAYATPDRDLAAFSRRSHEETAQWVRDYWRHEVERGTRIDVGDPEVARALDAASVVLLSCTERRGENWVPIGGPFQYRDVWLRDGARAIAALSVSGQTGIARRLADGFLLLQWPSGAFLSQRGQMDGSGQATWAFGQAMLRPAPSRELARFAESAYGAWKWSEHQRDLGRRIGGRFSAMLPFAEPRDGELTRAQLVGNDAWGIAGYRETARLLTAAGHGSEAREVTDALARYREEFAAALAASGSHDLPPSWQGPGLDWGNFTVAWPCEALSPDDPRVAAFAARVWRAGGGAGLTFYDKPDSLHGYLGADLGVWAMRVGRRAEADSVLDAHLHWRSASGTAGELFTRDGDFGRNLPPHPTSAAALWMLVRNALVFDDDDTLRLTLGARESWWRAGKVRRAPTRWGLFELGFSADPSRARWSWTAVPVWTALTLPPGTTLAAPPPAPLRGTVGATVVWAPPRTGEAVVALSRVRP